MYRNTTLLLVYRFALLALLLLPNIMTSSSFITTSSNNNNSNNNNKIYLVPAQCINNSNQHNNIQINKKNIQKKKKFKGQKKKKRNQETGFYPNIGWRVIPMDDLRLHPYFDPLPHPSEIECLENIQDVNRFRQDSIQWDLLHNGRCTTSRAACALGLLEEKAADQLKIPHSLRKRGIRAYDHLRGCPLRSLDEMNNILCNVSHSDYGCDEYEPSSLTSVDKVWAINKGAEGATTASKNKKTKEKGYHKNLQQTPFAAKYIRKVKLPNRRTHGKQKHGWSLVQARMAWGCIQESSAVLTALNYVCSVFPGSRIKEIGMCVGEDSGHAQKLNASGLLIGASPDAVIEYSDGTLAVLEVKNHCPFVPVNWKKDGMRSQGTEFVLGSRPPSEDVPTLYVCQLMLEMLCLGSTCRSAVMVRQTATQGASIIEVERDDEWIDEMLYFLNRFQLDFVNNKIPPPKDFFWNDDNDEEQARYRKFINRTVDIGKSGKLLSYIPNKDIQRVMHYNENGRPVRTPLFMDNLE